MSETADQLASTIGDKLRDFFAALDEAERVAVARAESLAEPFIGKKEAAEFLNMCVKTLEQRMSLPDGPPRYVDGGKVNFLRSELRAWRRQWRAGDQAGIEEPTTC